MQETPETSTAGAFRSEVFRCCPPTEFKAHLPHGHLSQLPYGVHKRHSVATPHQGEQQRTIATTKELSSQGLSLRAIAAVLNQMKVPTKNRGQKWLPETARRVLGRD